MAGILSTGITGIHAAQLGLQVTQHNIANVNTPGYNRQYLLQSSGVAQASGSGFMGSGTSVDSILRSYDTYLTQQTFVAQSRVSESETMLSKLNQIDNMFGDPSSGLASAVEDFFTGVQQVAANPSLVSARQSMLSASEVLASRFNSMSDRLSEIYDGVNGQITTDIGVINGYAQQIADVNSEIMRAEAASQQPANDLLDLRDQLVADLNKHIKVTTVEDSTGAFNVFVGSGQQLVVGAVANQMTPLTSGNDPERIVVGLKGPSGTVQELPENLIQGGSLGGLMSFRSGTLDAATNSLGAIAASLALTFNAQHALGQDLDGLNARSQFETPPQLGFQSDYFQIPTPRVLPNPTAANPAPTSVSVDFLAPSVNTTSGNFYTELTASDYTLRGSVSGGSYVYTLTRTSDGHTFSSAPTTPPPFDQATALADLNSRIQGEGIVINNAPDVDVDYLIQPTRQTALGFKLNPAIAVDTNRIAIASPVTSSLGAGNTGSLSITQGSVSPGYKLDNLSAASNLSPAVPTFTYSKAAQEFSFTVGSASSPVWVEGKYSDGTSQLLAVPSGGGATIDSVIPFGVSAAAANAGTGVLGSRSVVTGFDGSSYQLTFTASNTYDLTTTDPSGVATTTSGNAYTSGTPILLGAGAGQISISIFGAPAVGDTFDVNPASAATLVGINYDVTVDATGTAPVVTDNGISVSISGQPANNDQFSIGININGVSDNRNAVKLAALQVQSTMKDGKSTFQGAYASLVSLVGNETRQVKVDFEAQSTLLEQSQLARSEVSGVNLDEEAANLIKYQQAYQAAAKALEIASKLFDTLLSI